jgi:hypothetical protein
MAPLTNTELKINVETLSAAMSRQHHAQFSMLLLFHVHQFTELEQKMDAVKVCGPPTTQS